MLFFCAHVDNLLISFCLCIALIQNFVIHLQYTKRENKMNIAKQLVTPAMAKAFLDANEGNRKVKQHVILRYAQDITEGRWKENTAETIKIAKNGRLLDGQHRLMAVVKANKPVYFHVATDLDDEVFDVIDTGSNRTASDVMKIAGVSYSTVIPAVLSNYNLLKLGYSSRNAQKSVKSTNSQLLDQYQENPEYWQAVACKAMYGYKSFAKILPASVLGSMLALFQDIDEEDAETFFNQLVTGENATPVMNMLRQTLMRDKVATKKVSITMRNAWIIKAWNAFRKGETLKILKYDASNQKFPKPL